MCNKRVKTTCKEMCLPLMLGLCLGLGCFNVLLYLAFAQHTSNRPCWPEAKLTYVIWASVLSVGSLFAFMISFPLSYIVWVQSPIPGESKFKWNCFYVFWFLFSIGWTATACIQIRYFGLECDNYYAAVGFVICLLNALLPVLEWLLPRFCQHKSNSLCPSLLQDD